MKSSSRRFPRSLAWSKHSGTFNTYPGRKITQGGLRKFTADLIEDSADLIGCEEIHRHDTEGCYSKACAATIAKKLSWDALDALGVGGLGCKPSDGIDPDHADQIRSRKAVAYRRMDAKKIFDLHVKEARQRLASYLRALCEEPDVRFLRYPESDDARGLAAPWYFPRIAQALLRFIDRRAAIELAAIAETAVTREIATWLRKARRLPGRGVNIVGPSRFGKTQELRAEARAYPGRQRIVETPPTGGLGELLRSVGLAYGVEIGPRQRAYEFQALIEFVVKQSGLTTIFDEAHRLYPTTISRSSTPVKLEWVRKAIWDADRPCVFICTPQGLHDTRTRFLKATGYAIEQWDKRLIKVPLPDAISREDMMAIARIHMRGASEKLTEYVVRASAAATSAERDYCSDVADIAALAFLNAEDRGRGKVTIADIDSAVSVLFPIMVQSPEVQRSRKRVAESLPPPPGEPESVTPASTRAGASAKNFRPTAAPERLPALVE